LIENALMPASGVKSWAEAHGYRVHIVENGLEGLSWLVRGNIPEIIFAQAGMELIPASLFVSRVRESGFYQDIPIIAISAREPQELLAAMLRAGANGYIHRHATVLEINQKLGLAERLKSTA